MPRETPSPIDLPDPQPELCGLGWASVVIVIAAVVLLLANAVSLSGWIDEQPPGPLQARAAEIADEWTALTASIGLGTPRAALHAQWKRAEAARFASGKGEEGEGASPADQR